MTNKYREIKALKDAGKVRGYPIYPVSPKLGQFLPALPKGKCLHVTANTNVGKSQYWKWHFLIAPYLFIKLNPNTGFKPRWIIYLLEETFEQLYDSLVSNFVYVKHKHIITPSKLEGFEKESVSNEELKLIEDVVPAVEELLSYCKIVDNVYHPTGLFNVARTELLKNGKRFYTTIKESDIEITEQEYKKLPDSERKLYKFKKYVPNDPDVHWFVVTDNDNLIEGEMVGGQMLSIHDAIWKWSTDYAHKQLQKNYSVSIIDIIQQVGDSEKQQFTYKGDTVVEKVKPSRDGYGDNKRIARNADVILGLFAPKFYGITDYFGYDLTKIGDYFRTVIILKNRIGKGFKEIPLFFNGGVNYFAELNYSMAEGKFRAVQEGRYQTNILKL